MFISHPPKFLQRIYASLTWQISTREKELYLSFDDGPTPGVTEKVLDMLEEHQASATFFCLGKNVHQHPELFKKLKSKGHAVGNHSYQHLNGWRTNNADYIKDVMLASELIDSQLFRPPYGKIKSRQIRRLRDRFEIIMWSTLTRDYDPKLSKEQCLKISLRHLKPGTIFVLHDSIKAEKKMLFVLKELLKYGTEKGYVFKSLDQRL